MRRLKPVLWAAMLVGISALASFDTATLRYGQWMPYFMTRAELERSVFPTKGIKEMVDPGKIWIAGDNIYVVERYKGVHIIDNSNPAKMVQTGFIVAPGCVDVAVRGGVAYLDNAVDLVAYNLEKGVVTTRLKEYFPEPASPDGDRYRHNTDDGMILVGWKKRENRETR